VIRELAAARGGSADRRDRARAAIRARRRSRRLGL